LDADIWIVNDHHYAHEDVILAWKVLDTEGELLDEGSRTVDIKPDSSEEFHKLDCTIRGEDLAFFTVELVLEDRDGTILSENFHTLSIGDQKAAKQNCLKIHGELIDEKENLGKGYYRYHPELWNLD
jgi:hypothetical protein